MQWMAMAVGMAGALALSEGSWAGVYHRITLGGEITEVGTLTGTPFEDQPIDLRASQRWSIEVLMDAGAPDVLGPDLTAYGSSILSATITLDDYGMDLDFGSPGGIMVSSDSAGRVFFDATMMSMLDVRVLAEGIGGSPLDGLPGSLDLAGASRTRFAILDSGVALVAGTFDGYTFETLPAPGAALTLAAGGLLAARRRR
ncbi:MAG: hypothetical protein RIB60_02775 [Phycisphaerales bacterium]